MSATDTALQKMSRYRSVREAKGADCHELPVQPTQSAVCTTNNQNPSIARSMSRYRRNRPSANSSTVAAAAPPTPPMPDHARAQAQVVPPLPGAKHYPSAQEENVREKHRQDAMAQLTGGKETSPSKPLRSVKSEKVQVEKDVVKTKPTRSTPEARGLEGRRASAHASSNDNTRKSFFQRVGLSKNKDSMNSEESAPKYIGVGGGGIVPGTDAPISAVNAGERRVTVQYHNASVELPVTPSTQVQDLLLSASKKLSLDIDPEQFIVIESFHQVGLERNLRRYERVRDVMNSWAHDGDNRLIVIPPSSMDALAQLDAQLVPSEKPGETSVYLYYSQRPGKWDKRYVTLCPNGQVTIAKKESAKDHIAVCHLSDFDVYRPNARALAKEIKPPKKICVAIKSQQKSSMFLSTDKFVHFFSTNDHAMADKWLKVTQAWRSWYLVNKMGVTEKIEPDVSLPTRSLTKRHTGDSGPRPSTSKETYSQKKSSRDHAPPPSSFPKDLAIDTTVGGYGPAPGRPSEEMEATTFSPAGLLGRTYTQRKKAMHEREEREKRAKEQPFTEQGLLNESPVFSPEYSSNHQNSRSNTMTRAPDGLSRSLSASQKPKPLVDLTPVFQELPQHTRKGRGVTVEPGIKLVDAATGPEFAVSAMAIPSATTWRRPSAEVSSQTPYRSNTARSIRQASQPHKPPQMSSAEGSPTVPPNPFQPNSLLASPNRVAGQGKPFTGRGVATGDRNATQPLLDMSPENPFAEGSLLRKL